MSQNGAICRTNIELSRGAYGIFVSISLAPSYGQRLLLDSSASSFVVSFALLVACSKFVRDPEQGGFTPASKQPLHIGSGVLLHPNHVPV